MIVSSLSVLVASLVATTASQEDGSVPRLPGIACAKSLQDTGAPGCLRASSAPEIGKLFPLSGDFFIEAGTGRVGIGTTFPSARLSVAELGGPAFSIAMRVDNDSTAAAFQAQNTGNGSGSRSFCTSGFGTGASGGADDGGGSGFLFGSGVSGTTAITAPPFGPTSGTFGWAINAGGDDNGVYGQTDSDGLGAGVLGAHRSTVGTGAGVEGQTASKDDDAYGVLGTVTDTAPGDLSAGVRGVNAGTGSDGIGVYGSHAGTGWGVVGTADGAGRGVFGIAASGGAGVYGSGSGFGFGVFSQGDFGGTGAKYFLQPHPEDAGREIRFVCLEGNESGTYFRGNATLMGGEARIEVPEEFRLVTDAEGITVQVTPRGNARVWVAEATLGGVLVKGDSDVPFDYFVNGVRRGFLEHESIQPNRSFVPTVRNVPFGAGLPAESRRMLVESGVLNADFTPNEQTAAQMGWELRDVSADLRTASGGWTRTLPQPTLDAPR